jgi:hypothetical protein
MIKNRQIWQLANAVIGTIVIERIDKGISDTIE